MLPLSHFHHTQSYPFPFQSSHSIPLHHSHSFAIPFLTLHSHAFSCILVFHYQAFILFSLIPTLFIDSYNSSFLFNGTDIIHLISSLLTLITSLYLLSFSINLDSILCSMFYEMSISFPYLSLITPLSFYSISFYSYSYSFSPMPIHIHSLLCLFISSVLIPLFAIALNFSFPFIFISTHPILSLLLCYPISILQSIFFSVTSHSPLHPPSLLYSILIHLLILVLSLYSSSTHHSSHSFLSTSSSLSHSILIPSFIHFHFNTTLLYSSSSLFYKPLFDSILSFYSILLFVPRLLSITILLLLLLLITPLSTIILFHTHSHTLHSVHSLLS